jgi:hypothetical protein
MSDGSSHNRKRPIADIKAAHHGAVTRASSGKNTKRSAPVVNPSQFSAHSKRKGKTNPS